MDFNHVTIYGNMVSWKLNKIIPIDILLVYNRIFIYLATVELAYEVAIAGVCSLGLKSA